MPTGEGLERTWGPPGTADWESVISGDAMTAARQSGDWGPRGWSLVAYNSSRDLILEVDGYIRKHADAIEALSAIVDRAPATPLTREQLADEVAFFILDASFQSRVRNDNPAWRESLRLLFRFSEFEQTHSRDADTLWLASEHYFAACSHLADLVRRGHLDEHLLDVEGFLGTPYHREFPWSEYAIRDYHYGREMLVRWLADDRESKPRRFKPGLVLRRAERLCLEVSKETDIWRIANWGPEKLPWWRSWIDPHSDEYLEDHCHRLQYAAVLHWARTKTGPFFVDLAVAIRRYELDHQQLPQNLQKLVPTYLDHLDPSPFGMSLSWDSGSGTAVTLMPQKYQTYDELTGSVHWDFPCPFTGER